MTVQRNQVPAERPMNERINLVSGGFWGRNPHDELRWLRENAPVYWDEQGGVWGLSRYADVRFASQHPELFSNAEGIRPDNGPMPMMIDMDDPEHLRRRRLISRGFTPRRVGEQEPGIRKTCDEIIDTVCERGECDFVWDIAAQLPLIVIADALGVEPEDRAQLLAWSDDMLRGLTGINDPECLMRAATAFGGYTEYATEVIRERRKCPRDDLISTLVHAKVDNEQLEHDSLVQETLLILIGGDETTRHVLSGGAYQLMTHRDQWALLAGDPAKIPTAVEEMLRWVSPIKNMARTLTQDVDLGARRLRAGDTALLLYSSANRDAEVFPDPFRFDIERTPNEHIAFGHGTHFCLGNSLARLELRVMFEQLLTRLPDMSLVSEEEPEYRPANFVSGYETMPVRFTPARPSTDFAGSTGIG